MLRSSSGVYLIPVCILLNISKLYVTVYMLLCICYCEYVIVYMLLCMQQAQIN